MSKSVRTDSMREVVLTDGTFYIPVGVLPRQKFLKAHRDKTLASGGVQEVTIRGRDYTIPENFCINPPFLKKGEGSYPTGARQKEFKEQIGDWTIAKIVAAKDDPTKELQALPEHYLHYLAGQVGLRDNTRSIPIHEMYPLDVIDEIFEALKIAHYSSKVS